MDLSRLTIYDCEPKQLSPLTLAFIGDGVFDLFVREEIVCSANRPVKELNKLKVERVRCEAQARLFEKIEPDLTEEELETIREELYDEDTDWAVWEINEEVAKDYPTHTLDTMFYENPEDFIDEYCIIE